MRRPRCHLALRLSAVGLLVVLTLGQAGGAVHFLLVRHAYCVAHETWEHVSADTRDAAGFPELYGVASGEAPWLEARAHRAAHEHCSPAFCEGRRPLVPDLGSDSCATRERTVRGVFPSGWDAPRTSIPLTLLAPKHSPPA